MSKNPLNKIAAFVLVSPELDGLHPELRVPLQQDCL